MKIDKLNFEDTNNFSSIFLDYLSQKKELKKYYNLDPKPESFEEQIKLKKFDNKKRIILHEVLAHQYGPLETRPEVLINIHALQDDNCFTITTGHQLNIFTGPLYFIYKIITVINISRKLTKLYPEHQFVPAYWMASEDHDFEEISQFNLFNKTYKWHTDQTGPVGRFLPQSLNELINQLPEEVPVFEQAYLDQSSLTDSVRYYINELFGRYGLIAIDGDNRDLKALFKPCIKDDILEQKAFSLAAKTNEELNNSGYKTQINPREINFFYINNLRERITREDGKYKILNTDHKFTEEEILDLLESNPEKFSPNVVMRPLYQEVILPNLAYVGGPAELAYWLQLKSIFDLYQIPFPILFPRNFATIVNLTTAEKINKIGLLPGDFFLPIQDLKAKFLKKFAEESVVLDAEREKIEGAFKDLKKRAEAIDKSLIGFIGAEENKTMKSVDSIEKRLRKSEEKNHESAIGRIEKVQEKLFPDGKLQERHDNFLNFYINNPELIDQLLDAFDPFDFKFNILTEEPRE